MKKIITLILLFIFSFGFSQNSCSGPNIGRAGGGYLGSTKSLPRTVGETIEVDVTVRYVLNNTPNKLSYTVEGNNTIGSLTGSSGNFSAIGIKNYGGVYMGNDFMTLNTTALGCEKLMLGSRNEMATYVSYANCPTLTETVGGHVGPLPGPTNTATETKFVSTSGNILASHPIQIDAVDDHSAFRVAEQVIVNAGTCSYFQFTSRTGINPFVAPFKDYVAVVKFTLVFYKACTPQPVQAAVTNILANSAKINILTGSNAPVKADVDIVLADQSYTAEGVSTMPTTGYQRKTITSSNGTGFADFTNLIAGKTYKFRIRRYCDTGSAGPWSADQSFIPNIPNCIGADEVLVNDEKPDVAQNKTMDVRFWLKDAMSKTFDKVEIKKPDGSKITLPAGNYNYKFENIGDFTVDFITKKANGEICKQKSIFPRVAECTKCLEDGSKGAGKSIFYCTENVLSSYKHLILTYDCPTKEYRAFSTLGSGIDKYVLKIVANSRVLGIPNNSLKSNPEDLRPSCSNVGGLKENLAAFKFLMPKSNPSADKFDYLIATDHNPISLGINRYRYRNIVNIDQGSGQTTLFQQRQLFNESAGGIGAGNWTTVNKIDLLSNMSRSPASPNSYGFSNPTHEYYSVPSSSVGFGNWRFGRGVWGPWWTEKALNSSPTNEIECRTFMRTLEGSNTFYRVKVCNPCTLTGLSLDLTGEANFKISTNATLVQSASATKLLGSSGGVNIYYDHKASLSTSIAKEMFNCGSFNSIFASAIQVSRLDNSCPAQSNRIAGNESDNLLPSTIKKEVSFPNPFTTELNIKFTAVGGQEAYYQVYDLTGKQMYNSQIQKLQESGFVQETLDTSAWTAGVYIVKTFAGNGESSTQKVVKQ